MSGSTKTTLLDSVLTAAVASVGIALIAFMVVSLTPKKEKFVPMTLQCVDTQGKMATQDTTLRYFRDGQTLIGYDADGFYYVYTPPIGWVCKYGETKKVTSD